MSITALTYLGTTAVVAASPATLNNPATVGFGTTDPNRWIFALITCGTADRTFTSVTIGGVTATKLVEADGGGTTRPSAIYVANVPLNTNQDVVVTLSGSDSMQASLYSTVGNLDTTPIAIFTNIGQGALGTISLATRSGGVLLGVASGVSNANTFFTGDFDTNDLKNNLTGGGQASHKSTLNTGATLTNIITQNCGSIDTAIVVSMGPVNTDATSIDQTLSKLTQAVAIVEKMPSTIATTLKAPTQSLTVTMLPKASITQTLFGITQAAAVAEVYTSTIATTLPGLSQEIDITQSSPSAIATTLFGITQSVAAQSTNAAIATMLFSPTQALSALLVPNAAIATTLFAPTQALAVGMARNATIATTLFAPTQAAVVAEVFPSTIATTLKGFVQEFDAIDADNVVIDMLICAIGTHTTPLTPLVYLGQSAISAALSTVTFTDMAIGPDDPNRWVFICVTSGTAPRTFVGATIGGIAATLLVEADGSGTGRPSAIYVAFVPTGATADVVVTQTGTNNMQVSLFSTTGHVDVVPVDAFTRIVNGTPETVALNTRAGGVTLGIAAGVTAGNTFFGGDFDTLDWKNGNSAGGQGSHKSTLNDGSPIGVSVRSVGSIDTACAVSIGPAGGPGTALTQTLNMKSNPVVSIDQTLSGLSQQINVRSFAGVIAQTLRALTTSASVTVTLPPGAINTDIATLLPGMTQEIDIHVTTAAIIDQTFVGLQLLQEVEVTSTNFDIDQTLPSFGQQEIDIVEIMVAHIDQTLAGFGQVQDEIDIVEIMVGRIDQTLAGFQQEIDVQSFAGVIDQTLTGFGQVQDEIDIVEIIPTFIDQTLPSFTQDFEGHVEEPAGVIAAFIDQTLPSFSQEIDVSALKMDIKVELQGMTQRIDIHLPLAVHQRAPHAVGMPSKDMPIHPGELEFFRRKVYGRAVDAMVPPPIIARNNLTTQRHPYSRPVVNRTPLGKKPS